MRISDPMEAHIAETLEDAGIKFIHESDCSKKGLDFMLPDLDCYIEVKQFHSDRIAKQMARVKNVIVIQGMGGAIAFRKIIERED